MTSNDEWMNGRHNEISDAELSELLDDEAHRDGAERRRLWHQLIATVAITALIVVRQLGFI